MLIFGADFFVPDCIWYEKSAGADFRRRVSAPISGVCVLSFNIVNVDGSGNWEIPEE